MALSGSYYKAVGSYWRLRIDWTATQNVAANTSTVTAKMYFQAVGNNTQVYSTASKSCVLNVNASPVDSTCSVGVSANGSKLLQTVTKTISHNADGTATFTTNGACNLAVTLSGTYYGYVEVGLKTWTLNTIPRASTMSSSANMGFDHKSFSLSSASSSFRHTINFYVNDTWIKRVEGVVSSGTFSFSQAEFTAIANALAQKATGTTKFTVTTYSGGTSIGTKEKTGTISAPGASSWKLNSTYYIGDTMGSTLTRQNKHTSCDIGIYTTDGATKIATVATGTQSSSVSYATSNISSTLYSKMGSSNSYYDVIVKIWTKYNGVQLNTGPYAYKIRIYASNSNPVFTNTSAIYYQDSNSTITALTGDNKHIVQNKSNLTVGVDYNYKATAQNGATMSYYLVECAGKSAKLSYSTTANVSASLGTINVSADTTVTVTAVDSRGLKTSLSKKVTVVPYTAPQMTLKANRVNNFEADTTVSAKILCSSVSVRGTAKNSLSSFKYQTREANGTWGTLTSATTSGFPAISKDLSLTLDNAKAWDIKVIATDAFGGSVTKTVSIETGKPLLFLNTETNSVGINRQTTSSNRFEVGGNIYLTGSEAAGGYVQAGTFLKCGASRFYTSDSTYGLHLNNSDIIGANGIYFNDSCTGVEGINFPKSSASTNSTTQSDYNNFRVLDGSIYLDDEVVFSAGKQNTILKTIGGLYMHAEQKGYTPSKSLSACENGWLLIWSGYDITNAAVQNNNWNFQFIPKEGFTKIQEYGTSPLIACQMVWNGTPVRKLLYTNGVAISGHNSNQGHVDPGYEYGFYDNRRLVLRWIYEY